MDKPKKIKPKQMVSGKLVTNTLICGTSLAIMPRAISVKIKTAMMGAIILIAMTNIFAERLMK